MFSLGALPQLLNNGRGTGCSFLKSSYFKWFCYVISRFFILNSSVTLVKSRHIVQWYCYRPGGVLKQV